MCEDSGAAGDFDSINPDIASAGVTKQLRSLSSILVVSTCESTNIVGGQPAHSFVGGFRQQALRP